ncbi:hypothetical protein [Anabaena catenula]|uniref:Uncharacterized protein n=1 Tax=Anabaena catenula FACHB-362 TaxID=2692877 RepID=A0ABR8IZP1_9NOST|nr:hypothetical protein [Anabaena catenula]MBD2691079.1 hypothetical protein [Anabaena catenula FACHB-362]
MSNKKRVLFFSPYGSGLVHKQVDAVVATSLRLRGCEVLVVGCDRIYQNCAVTRFDEDNNKCQQCTQIGKHFFAEVFELPYIQIGSFIESDDYAAANNWLETVSPDNYANAIYQDLAIGQWVTSTIYTYFRISAAGLSRKDVQIVHRKYLIDGFVTYKALVRIFSEYQPTNIFLFNGRFAPYQVAFEVARLQNIDVITHERAFIDDSFMFFDNYPTYNTQPILDCVKSWENTTLTHEEIQQTKNYFIHREYGVNMNWHAFYNFQTNYLDVRYKLRIPSDAKILVVFTSSEDELAALTDRAKITAQFEIIANLIEIFRNRTEYLVIRHHPFIAGNLTDISETYSLTKAYKQIFSAPENVRFVMPSEQLTSYSLLWNAEAAIACFSTVAIETIARGIPTAILATSAYEKASQYIITDTTVEHLTQIVESLLVDTVKITTDDLKRVYRFTNSFFFKFSHKFRSLGIKDIHFLDLRFKTVDELQPGNDPTLDKICDRIMTGASFANLPGEDFSNRISENEEAFYQEELLAIEQYKKLVRQQTVNNLNNLIIDPLKVGIIYLNYKANYTDGSKLSSDYFSQSRYKNILIHEVNNCESDKYEEIIEDILSLIEDTPAEYILVANNYTQYDESFISSSLDILTSPDSQNLTGVFSAAWLSSIEDRIEDAIFMPGLFNTQGQFLCRSGKMTYAEAVRLLPILGFPLTLLSFTIFSKNTLRGILQSIQGLSVIEASQQVFASIFESENVFKLELPKLIIRQELAVFQDINLQYLVPYFQETLNLREVNLIMFPNWEQLEEAIVQDLITIIKSVVTDFEVPKTTLLIHIGAINEEDAQVVISTAIMQLIMEENIEISDELQISFVGILNEKEWEALKATLHAQMIVNQENQMLIPPQLEGIPKLWFNQDLSQEYQ